MLLRFIAAVIALLVAHAAFAQGTPAQRAACRPDVVKFCKGKGEDPGVLLQCLEDNRDKISEKCRNVLIEVNGPAPTAAKKEAPAALPEKKEDKPAQAKEENKEEKK